MIKQIQELYKGEGELTIFYYSKVKSPHPSTVNMMPQTPLMKSFINPILTNLILNPIYCFNFQSELKTFEWDILNPDRIINLEIKFMRTTSNI